MEMETALENLQELFGCPICLNYFKDPVTTGCGHNFCSACLSRSWKDLRDTYPCPVCQVCFPQRSFRRNRQLCNLTEMAKGLTIRRSKRRRQEENVLCRKHHRFLTLFCMKDKEVLCTRCSLSVEHQTHYICHVKTAALYHRKILENMFKPLKDNVERVEKILVLQGSKLLDLKKEVEQRKKEIHFELEQFGVFLRDELEALMKGIEFEGLGILSKLRENFMSLSDHASTLNQLLGDIEDETLGPDPVLLTRARSIYQRLQNLKCPELLSFRLKRSGLSLPPQYSALDRIIKVFQTDVHLDLHTAHAQLRVSEDRKIVQFSTTEQNVRESPQRFLLSPSILGFERFVSGRHYWEVEVGRKREWTLGVCEESLPRTWQNRPSVVEGLWAIGMYPKTGCVAFGPMKAQGLPELCSRKIGIFLDYDLGEVSFYDSSDKSLIYMFDDRFSKAICPYFNAGTDSMPLKISPLPGYE